MLYRATLPITVLAFRENFDAAFPIGATETFEVIGQAEDDRFAVVKVKGEEFLVFSSDLEQRCARLP
jgi:hypothetical protein